MLSGADAGIKMNSTILSSIHIIERNDKNGEQSIRMEPQESSQADEGEQEAPGLPEVRYTGFRGTQGCYENGAGKWIKRKNLLPSKIVELVFWTFLRLRER